MLNVIQDYTLYFSQEGRKKSTLRTHLVLLKALLKECPLLSEQEIVKFLLNLKTLGRNAGYINHFIDVLRNVNKFHPLPYIPKYFKEGPPAMKSTMSDDEIESFLSLPCPVCRHVSTKGLETTRVTDPRGYEQMTLFWKICAFTGMRMGEVANLTIDRCDFGRSIFILEDTKTNTPRYVPIATNIQKDVQEYISHLMGNYLFPSRRGGNDKGPVIDDVDWHYSFKNRIKRLGIKRKGLTPYSFRHSMATRLLEEDVSFPKVMKIMGHRDPKTTLQYEHLTTKDLQSAITKHPLVRRSTDCETILNALVAKVEDFNLRHDNRFYFKMNRENGALFIEIKAKH